MELTHEEQLGLVLLKMKDCAMKIINFDPGNVSHWGSQGTAYCFGETPIPDSWEHFFPCACLAESRRAKIHEGCECLR